MRMDNQQTMANPKMSKLHEKIMYILTEETRKNL